MKFCGGFLDVEFGRDEFNFGNRPGPNGVGPGCPYAL